MNARPCIIGLDEPEYQEIRSRCDSPIIAHATLPRILVQDGELFVESSRSFGWHRVSRVVYHAIFEDDHDFIAGLALWGGPCLPNARAMMDCRLKLPCLVRALGFTKFGSPPRGFASPGASCSTEIERVAKWGNWHCGENKERFTDRWQAGEDACIIEPYFPGKAVRVLIIGDHVWQISLDGNDWLKSIHHPNAHFMEPNPDLVADTRHIAQQFGLEIAANDYIVTDEGVPHLLEVNHIPNVTRFPEIREGYTQFVVDWLGF